MDNQISDTSKNALIASIEASEDCICLLIQVKMTENEDMDIAIRTRMDDAMIQELFTIYLKNNTDETPNPNTR